MAESFLIVAARFNEYISKSLVDGAREALVGQGIPAAQIELVWVPGAFEIPVVARHGAKSGKYAAVICLGAVIRGATPHFDHVAGQAASGMMSVSLETGVPVMFGVLTTDNAEQALERCGIKHMNKGREAALGALETLSAIRSLRGK